MISSISDGESIISKKNSLQQNSDTDDDNIESSDDEANQNISLNEENSLGNPAWADCIANVLRSDKPKSKKSLVLSRAKKLNQTTNDSEKKSYDFEIEGEEIKEEKPEKQDLDLNLLAKIKREKHENKVKTLSLRIKPSLKDREREKALKKIATKGVVQLFNAVRIQQKEIDKELENAGPLDHRKDAVLQNINKRRFLDILMSGKRAKSELIDNPIKDEIKREEVEDDDNEKSNDNKSEWNVLRDDFMTNKKLKHWDQESNDSEGNEENQNNSDTMGDSDDSD